MRFRTRPIQVWPWAFPPRVTLAGEKRMRPERRGFQGGGFDRGAGYQKVCRGEGGCHEGAMHGAKVAMEKIRDIRAGETAVLELQAVQIMILSEDSFAIEQSGERAETGMALFIGNKGEAKRRDDGIDAIESEVTDFMAHGL